MDKWYCGICLGHGKAVEIVGHGGIDHQFLAVPDEREGAVAVALVGQVDGGCREVVPVECQFLERVGTVDVEDGVIAVKVGVVVEHRAAVGRHAVAVSQIAVVGVNFTVADLDAADARAAIGAHDVKFAVIQQVAAGKAQVVAAAKVDDLGG